MNKQIVLKYIDDADLALDESILRDCKSQFITQPLQESYIVIQEKMPSIKMSFDYVFSYSGDFFLIYMDDKVLKADFAMFGQGIAEYSLKGNRNDELSDIIITL